MNSTRFYLMQRLAAKANIPLIMSQRILDETETVLRTAEITLREIRERRQRTKLPRQTAQAPAPVLRPDALRAR